MEVKFIKCSKANLSNVRIVNGQLIALTDSSDIYYDMESGRTRCCSLGTSSNSGLVKLSDNYKSSGGAAASSIGASSKAVYDCYSELASKLDALPTDRPIITKSFVMESSVLDAEESFLIRLGESGGYVSNHVVLAGLKPSDWISNLQANTVYPFKAVVRFTGNFCSSTFTAIWENAIDFRIASGPTASLYWESTYAWTDGDAVNMPCVVTGPSGPAPFRATLSKTYAGGYTCLKITLPASATYRIATTYSGTIEIYKLF